jgi:hypothetical protein
MGQKAISRILRALKGVVIQVAVERVLREK